jgi:hypothetical protein
MKKKIILISLFFLLFFCLSNLAARVYAQDATLNGLDDTASQVDAFAGQTSQTYNTDFFSSRIGQIIGAVLAFVGVLFLLLIIYAGITWMTAAGNETTITKAKTLIINATIGLIIILAAYAITSFLGEQVLQLQ